MIKTGSCLHVLPLDMDSTSKLSDFDSYLNDSLLLKDTFHFMKKMLASTSSLLMARLTGTDLFSPLLALRELV